MNIPDKAMDAAFRAATGDAELHLDDRMYWEQVARDMLAAAVPFIAAQALRDAADLFAEEEGVEVLAFAGDFTEVHAVMAVETWLRERSAIELEAGQ